jgi:glycosyltransferase involved in cell wall biosynthesis
MALHRSRSPLVFVLPAGSEAPSGGNVYDRELTKALAERVPLVVTTFDDATRRIASKRPGLYFFDTLELDKAPALPERNAEQRFGLVVHHLPSLEPGVAPDDPALAMEASALDRFDIFLATSDFTKALLTSRGHAESTVLTVPPALSAFTSPPRAYEGPLSALVVANLIPRKGVLPLIEALARLEAMSCGFSLRIVGRDDMDAAYVEACRRTLAASNPLRESVRFEGSVPYERMGDVYETSDLLVSAATMETFGMAIHEARAHGLPVLARDGGYVSAHFTHGHDGVLCASTDELAEELVALSRDEPAMSALFERAQSSRPASGYTWRAAAEKFLSELDRTA